MSQAPLRYKRYLRTPIRTSFNGLNSGTARISQLVSHVVSVSTPSVPLSSSDVSTTVLSSTTGLESMSGDDTEMRVTCASKISAHVEASS